jgi:phage tail P2-like protein
MTSLKDSQIIDILPDILKYRPDVQAVSYAIRMQIARIYDLSQRCRMLADVDVLGEDVLDLLAIELQSIYYDTSLPIDKKRDIIRSTLRWHWYGGTKASVEDYIRTIFGGGDVTEWYEYGGSPYTFKIDAEDTGSPMSISRVIETIFKIKRPDTTFETYIGEPTTIRIRTQEEGWLISYDPAGTLPDESTRLLLGPSTVKAITSQKGYLSPWVEPGEITAGTLPDESTRTAIHREMLIAAAAGSGYLTQQDISGDTSAGTSPTQAMEASINRITESLETQETGYETSSHGGEELITSLETYTVQYQPCGSDDPL